MDWKTSEKMLFQVLSAFANGKERADFSMLSPTYSDWGSLFGKADEQQILPVVYEMTYGLPELSTFLNEERNGDNIGQKYYDKIRKTAIRTIGRQAYRADLFLHQYEQLLNEKIEPVVMKGIVVRDVYALGDHRVSADEDIWVPADQFMQAVDMFQKEGYAPLDEIKETAQEIGWMRPDGSYIELHRRLFGEGHTFGREISELMEGAYERHEKVTLKNGKCVWSFAPQDHFLYLILHAYKHFVGSGVGIRQVMDIGVYGRTFAERIDWQKLFSDLKKIRAEYFTGAIFWICENVLEIPVAMPSEWRALEIDGAPLLADMLGAGLCGNASMERLHTATITLNQVEADRTKTKTSIWKTAFPPKENLVGTYPELKTKPWLLPFVWMKRLFKYLKETKSQKNNDTMETLRLGKERTELLRMYKIIE